MIGSETKGELFRINPIPGVELGPVEWSSLISRPPAICIRIIGSFVLDESLPKVNRRGIYLRLTG